MEQITLSYPATRTLYGQALAGVVGSGDMEALFVADQGERLEVDITTSVVNFEARWRALFDRLSTLNGLPSGKLTIHDFGATPGVARIRIEQVFEGQAMRNDSSFIELRARERARLLLDEGSYRELLDPFDGVMSPRLPMQGIVPQADDGMVVAKGTIDGKPTVVIAIEGTFRGGSMGEVSGAKMAAALELAAEDHRRGVPTQAVLCPKPAACAYRKRTRAGGNCRHPRRHRRPATLYPGRRRDCGTVGCFGGMSIAAGLCSSLIVTREARRV